MTVIIIKRKWVELLTFYLGWKLVEPQGATYIYIYVKRINFYWCKLNSLFILLNNFY